jgi:hypothetical protein
MESKTLLTKIDKEKLKNFFAVSFMVVSASVFCYTFNDILNHKIRVDWVNAMADKNNNGYLEPSEKKRLFEICGNPDKPTHPPITREEYEIAEKYYFHK